MVRVAVRLFSVMLIALFAATATVHAQGAYQPVNPPQQYNHNFRPEPYRAVDPPLQTYRPLARTCGGFAGLRCRPSQFCAYPSGRPFPDQSGVCQTRPRFCPQIFQPVCGRDHHTYPNACVANSNGVSVLFPGRCPGR